MIFSLVILCSMLLGFALAELGHRKNIKKYERERLITEYFDKQLWQFISIDEWIRNKP